MPRPKGARNRVVGIEERRGAGAKRFRLHLVVDGERVARGFASRREAEAFAEIFKAEHCQGQAPDDPFVRDLITRWLEAREHAGEAVYPYHRHWVQETLIDVLDERSEVLEGTAFAEGYAELAGRLSGASNRCVLACLRSFAAWLLEAHYVKTDPVKGLKPRGSLRRGKAQIETVRELMAFRDVVWQHALEGDRGYLGVLLGLYLGLRSGEVRRLEARHVDVGMVLRVPGTKTDNAPRSVPVLVPELWELLERTAAHGGRLVPLTWQPLVMRVKRAAHAAGVANWEALNFHSLRGMASSLAARGGAAFEAIARGLGHGDERVTLTHYVTRQAQAHATQQQLIDTLKRSTKTPSDSN